MLRGIAYFALVFAAGLVLGTIRVPWLVPRVGERVAVLMEAPFMIVAIAVAARLTTGWFPARRRRDYGLSGLLALALMLAAELGVGLALRGLRPSETLSQRDPVAGAVYVALLAAFAAMPWLVGRSRDPA